MPELIPVAPAEEVPPGNHRTFNIEDLELAIFNLGGQWAAVENRCPHNGASLALGTVEAGVVACPWHGWKFELQTGTCVGRPGVVLRRFPVTVRDGFVCVDVESPPATSNDGISRYLVRYGTLGWIGWFGSIEKISCDYRDQVLVQTSRGQEIGELLVAPDPNGPRERPSGELLRLVTSDDADQLSHRKTEARRLLKACHALIAQRHLPLDVVDAEALFDGTQIMLYYLGPESEQLSHLAEELGRGCEARVVFHPLVDAEEGQHGGCGAGGCGCGG